MKLKVYLSAGAILIRTTRPVTKDGLANGNAYVDVLISFQEGWDSLRQL
jgi:hypothetical protein